VGRNASKFQVGDAVYGRPDVARDGTYAEFIAVRESELALKPRTISHIEAAALPLAGIAAWESLITVGKVAAGQRVLVHAAAGGVGSLAVQIAKARGAYVVGTGSAGSRTLIESLHADEFVDHHSQQLQDIAGNMNLVFDTIGGATQEASWSLLASNGILVSITDPPSQERARKLGVRAVFVFIQPNAPVLEQMAQWVNGGVLRPVIGAEFALSDIRQAHALSEVGSRAGKDRALRRRALGRLRVLNFFRCQAWSHGHSSFRQISKSHLSEGRRLPLTICPGRARAALSPRRATVRTRVRGACMLMVQSRCPGEPHEDRRAVEEGCLCGTCMGSVDPCGANRGHCERRSGDPPG
jgi:hypothetical protein